MILTQKQKEVMERIVEFMEKGILINKNFKPKISEKLAFKYYTQYGIPKDILEDWINEYIYNGYIEPIRT